MYTQVIKVLPIPRLGYLAAYRCLRERNGFGILASVRFALWLAYGNPLFPPGEFAAWFNRQVEEHPVAVGITLGICGYAFLMWIVWMIVPHGYFGRW